MKSSVSFQQSNHIDSKLLDSKLRETLASAQEMIRVIAYHTGETSDTDDICPLTMESILSRLQQNFQDNCDDEGNIAEATKKNIPIEQYVSSSQAYNIRVLLLSSLTRLMRTQDHTGNHFMEDSCSIPPLAIFITNLESGGYIDFLSGYLSQQKHIFYELFEQKNTKKFAQTALEIATAIEKEEVTDEEKDITFLQQKLVQSIETIIDCLITLATNEIAMFNFDNSDPINHRREIDILKTTLSILSEIADLYFESENNPEENNPELGYKNRNRDSAMDNITLTPPRIH